MVLYGFDMNTNYEGLTANAMAGSHLGGNIFQGDPYTYSPKCWDYLIDRFAISSVMDIGGGRGYSGFYFHKRGLKVISIDGCPQNVANSIFPTVLHDLTSSALTTRVDLVHCQEVVEHIEEKYIDNLMRTMACGSVVCMTHALPGQGGHHHVNLQPSEYWINLFQNYGYALSIEDTKRIRSIAKSEGAQYLSMSGLIFLHS